MAGLRIRASDNHAYGNGSTNGSGIWVFGSYDYCLSNTVDGLTINIDSLCNSSGNPIAS